MDVDPARIPKKRYVDRIPWADMRKLPTDVPNPLPTEIQ